MTKKVVNSLLTFSVPFSKVNRTDNIVKVKKVMAELDLSNQGSIIRK
jgi:hypothetical protein